MEKLKYKVTIKTETPFNINSGLQDDGFIDQITVRDINGNPYIPGSTIKGKIRDNFAMLHGEIKTKELFGYEDTYSPSKIFVDNFYLINNNYSLATRFGNRINRYRCVAADSALFSKEVINGTFIGEIEIKYQESFTLKEEIVLAIKMITSIGGGNSRGLGKVNIELEEV